MTEISVQSLRQFFFILRSDYLLTNSRKMKLQDHLPYKNLKILGYQLKYTNVRTNKIR